MRRSLKPLVITLVCIFVVSAVVTGIFFATRIFPDISSSGFIGGINSQPYSDSWSLPFIEGQGLKVDVIAVNVDIRAHGGADVQASFEGSRSPDGRGELPYIEAVTEGGGVVLRERNASDNTFTIGLFSSGGGIHGTLTILVPQARIGDFYVDSFSGGVAASDIDADRITVEASSGYVNLTNASASHDIFAETFSGDHMLSGLSGKNVTLNSSSGRIIVASLRAASLNMESFSGAMEISEAAIDGEARLDASSGSITLADFNAGSLYTEQSSGRLNLNDTLVYGAVGLKTLNGAITGQNVSINDLTFKTFSGAVKIDGLTSGAINGETSSGAVDIKLGGGANASITTFSGGVTLKLPRNTGYNYTLDSFSGGINIDDGGAGNSVAENSKNTMRGTVGSGEYAVKIDTSSGNISIVSQ